MRKVIYSEYVRKEDEPGKPYWELQEIGEAVFHQFGFDYEQGDNGVGTYSTAIIELDDGTVKNIPVGQIRFLKPVYSFVLAEEKDEKV